MTQETGSSHLSVFIVGTRAQLIKIAPVIVACERLRQPVLILLTGQHKETMQDLVLEFGIASSQEAVVNVVERATVFSLLRWAPAAYFGLRRSLERLKSSSTSVAVVVHGDTLSTVIGAAAARRSGVRVVHLESGLTSGRLLDPFPEELSRRLVFRMTDVAICPGEMAAGHMRKFYPRCRVVDSHQNTIVDSVMLATQSKGCAALTDKTRLPYVVASLHRFQNIFDSRRLSELVGLLAGLSAQYSIHFVLHPATKKRLESEGLLSKLSMTPRIHLSPRLGYREFLQLAAGAAFVLTDGGSNQEELAVLGVPTIIMRQHTERSDGLGANAVMEGDLGMDLLDYCLEQHFLQLRRPSSVKAELEPSMLVARLLSSDGL